MVSSPSSRLAVIGHHCLPSSGPSPGPIATADGATVELTKRVDAIFAKFFAKHLAPGVAYGVVMDGQLVHKGGLGTLHVGEDHPPGPASVFRIASMTKSFLAATVLLLRDEGTLRLDDTVEHWVPELRGLPLATADSVPPTIRQLLSMSAGYPEDDPWADRLESLTDDEYTALISKPKSFSRTSGVAFEYSNFGFTLLGRVIQNATGRPFREIVSERILEPLGLASTTWSDEGIDRARLATGYALVDGVWVSQPIQAPGAFSALGGLYSTVSDLAVWVAGFIDAWPPRDGTDSHPLSRASRREMQQAVTRIPSQLGGGKGVSRTQVADYCMGLISVEDLKTGRTINHSGGYPGFGSNMVWHPVNRIGVIALANGRYAGPAGAAASALAALVEGTQPRLYAEPHAAVEGIHHTINKALMAGDFTTIRPLLADNVDLDEELSRRASKIAELRKLHGALTPEADSLKMTAPMSVSWSLFGERGRVGVAVMLSPEHPPKVQKLDFASVLPATAELEAFVDSALSSIEQGSELSSALLPIKRTFWVQCDGSRSGTVLVEGANADFHLYLNLAGGAVRWNCVHIRART